ncbi:MAG: septum formation initiator family protein [Spirochaetota bacterium]
MKRTLASRAITAVWIAFGSYSLLAITTGPGGLFAWQAMGKSIDSMRANMETLKERNLELSSDFASLRSDPDRALREARALGYLPEGEYEIVLSSEGHTLKKPAGPGEARSFERPDSAPDSLVKSIALGLGLVYFVLVQVPGVADMKGSKTRRKPVRPSSSREKPKTDGPLPDIAPVT